MYSPKDVMNLAAIMVKMAGQESESSKWWSDFKFVEVETREQLREELDRFEDEPIHPHEVFDMIVGGGTGALISFALVGGNRNLNYMTSAFVGVMGNIPKCHTRERGCVSFLVQATRSRGRGEIVKKILDVLYNCPTQKSRPQIPHGVG